MAALFVCTASPRFGFASGGADETFSRLALAPMWQRLLHYEPDLFGSGVHSTVDSAEFFLAPQGRHDPRAELAATLAALARAPETACRFPARTQWLRDQLGTEVIPPVSCPAYERWRADHPVAGVTLIFASSYLDNPASMFGHTLLRLDAPQQDERTRLLAQTIGFSATDTDPPGVRYAINGVFGAYAGRFSMAPYFLKVQEYADIENRDIWEYRLNLGPEQIDRMLAHLWELRAVSFHYYFFDENCSYQVLGLLETARPDLDLSSRFHAWAIPLDTVRAVISEPGLLREAVFRPARATLIRARASRLDARARLLAHALARHSDAESDQRLAVLAPSLQADVLELAYEEATYRGSRTKGVSGPHVRRGLLDRRSRLPASAAPEVPTPPRPDEGHDSARLALSGGSRNGTGFMELRWRPANHDLLDDERGYARGVQLAFLDVTARRYTGGPVRLERLDLFDAISLVPWNDYLRARSWFFAGGWRRIRARDGSEPLVFGLHGGPGLAVDLTDAAPGRPLVYGVLDFAAQAHPALRRGYAAGAGPVLAWLFDPAPRWRVRLEAGVHRFAAGDSRTSRFIDLEQRITLGRNAALRAELRSAREFDHSANEMRLGWYSYY